MTIAPNAAHLFGNSSKPWVSSRAMGSKTVPTGGNVPHRLTQTCHHGRCYFYTPSQNDSDGKPNTPPRNSQQADHHPTTVRQQPIKPPERGDDDETSRTAAPYLADQRKRAWWGRRDYPAAPRRWERQVSTHQETMNPCSVEKGQDMDAMAALKSLPPLIAIPTAAKLLGISRSAAYRYAAMGDLPTRHLGGRVYIVTALLHELISNPDNGSEAA
jgi:hypothetical protein